MPEKRVRCIDCTKISKLKDEDITPSIEAYGLCSGEGGTKNKSDIFADRLCSRYEPGKNNLKKLKEPECDRLVKCLSCGNLIKVPYLHARPTHHENWECPSTASTKQFEDCEAKRCCNKYRKGKFQDKS